MESSPLIRRMNSMLLGHHGASLRTDCMYFWIASCVAGSSQESGRWTIRVGTSMSSMSGNRASAAISVVHQLRSSGSTRLSKWTCSERMPGVRSMMPGERVGLQIVHQRVDAEPQVQVQHQRAVLDEQILVAVLAIDDGRTRAGATRGCGAGSACPSPTADGDAALPTAIAAGWRHATGVQLDQLSCAASSSLRLLGCVTATEADGIAGLELAHLPEVGLHDGGRADEAAEARAVGAEDDRACCR